MNLNNLFKSFLIILLFSVLSFTLKAQNYLSINLKNKSVKELLNRIEEQTDYTFVYSINDIDINKNISIKNKNIELNDLLQQVCDAENITYQIIGKQIILTKKDRSSDEINLVTISGTVYSKHDSLPLPGVNVFLKNTSLGTSTNINGVFSLTVPGDNNILAFSFLGFKTFELNTGKQSNFNIFLEEDPKIIDEVVIIGYGKESKKLLSSSVSDIRFEKINETFTPNISESIKGKLTGIMVNQNSGTPGAATTLRIRGISSITAGADPLYIIDGVPIIAKDLSQVYFNGQSVNSIFDINLQDIESITILKDASATAIYGARGSNGVVLITTKRGNGLDSFIRFNAKYGLQKVAKTYDMLNAEQFMNYKNDAAINSGGIAVYSEEDIANNFYDTDWQKELYRISPVESYDLSFTGGSENTRYYITGSYFNQEGIVEGTDYKRISSRINLDHQFSEKLDLGTSFSINRSINNRKEGDQSLNGPVPNAISLPPIYPVYNEDGTFNEDGPLANPISIAKQHVNVAYSWHNFGNIFVNYNILKNLTYKIKYGVDYVNFREHTYDPVTTRQGAKYQGLGIETTSEALKTLFSHTFNYSKIIKTRHIFFFFVGYEVDKEQVSSSFMRGETFASEKLEYLANAVEKVSAEAYLEESVINSVFGRIKYNLNNKYIATLNARYDGSSRFSKENRYGFFPSGDIAWRISEEDFLNLYFIDDLKIRSSYGITGNDKIPEFLYIAQFGASEYAGSPTVYPVNISNPSLKWETTKQFNIGLDASLINNRISLNFDYYHKKTEDLLLENPIPPSSGYGQIITNTGKIENKGIEVNLETINIDKILHWESQLSVSFNKNKVTKLYNDQAIDNIGRGYQRIEVGEPIGIFYGYKSLGVDPSTGDLVFEDVNKDGIIDVNDKTKIGSPHAIFQGGFSNIFTYNNIELNVFLQFSYGNDVFNGTRRYIESMKDANNQTTAVLDRWQEPGDITDVPKASNADPNENNRVSSRFVEDGSYLKIKTIRLSYDLNNNFIDKLKIKDFKIFLLGQNLFTFTNYSGLDPEVNYAGSDVIRNGVEFFTYPPAKIYSAGITIKF